ncbi:BQ2448_7853 [Microbotryum intermedium]|uniref:BQ2448_7853 protein n=1 Tax=Microbotryum intermedium TaxID=269621 RepID=A0A238FSJ6_9BASI|nr:BQ2448_7853 [Microbotryum intermedium]
MAYPHNIEYGYSLHQAKGKQAWGQHTEKAPHRLKPLILRKRGSAFAQDEHICTLVVEIHDKDGKIVTYGDGHECRAESNKFQFMSRNHAATSKKRRLESIANLESDQQLAYNEIYKDEELERARPQPHSMTSHPFGEPAPRPAKPKPDPRHHWTDRIALISQYLAYKHAGRIKQNLYEPRLLTREDFPLLMEASVEHYQEMSFGDSDEVEPNSVLRSRGSMDFRSPREYYTYDFASVERRINAVLDLLESRQEPLPYLVDTCVNFTLHTVLFREETVPPSDAEQRPTVKLSVHTLGEEGAILRRVNPLYALAWLVVSSSTHSEHVSNWVIRPYQEAMIAEGIRFDDSDIERFRWILHLVHLDQLLHWLSDNRQSYLSAFASRVLEQEIELAQTREGANMPRSMNFEA